MALLVHTGFICLNKPLPEILDNDPKHTSRLCKGYLTKERDGVLHQMTWPPQSPDLNPIEMVWDELDRRGKEKQPTSAQHMWELFQDCWKAFLMKLVEKMPSVCKAVMKSSIQHQENLPPVPYDEERFPSVHVVPPLQPSGSSGKDGESKDDSEAVIKTEEKRNSEGGGGYTTRGAAADLSSHNPLSSSSKTEVLLHPYPKTLSGLSHCPVHRA
ncbi:hypothetical protein J4Q44_G00371500 [Coregonus suidteri]|uniref:Tc1-like transposase DDE domain-containing protein n=1 Tax=Coregonus suidteri TaxID=861788 RepID=A0AAN8QAJ5_9TELE